MEIKDTDMKITEIKDTDMKTPKTKNINNPLKRKEKKLRCHFCQKRLKLHNTYTCKCTFQFCENHRYSHAHNCTYDYKSISKELIQKNNQEIIPKKLIFL
tara:strand:+ start:169 stop:468 length:300 start_codon:yes stop_codon:yes gene_type:complete